MFLHPLIVIQAALLTLFSILFLQSGLDKVFDRKGNLDWLEPHFANSSLKSAVKPLLALLTLFELASGVMCIVALIFVVMVASDNLSVSSSISGLRIAYPRGEFGLQVGNWVLAASTFVLVTLLQLFFGQRIAKDYAGAASLVPYLVAAVLLTYSVYLTVGSIPIPRG